MLCRNLEHSKKHELLTTFISDVKVCQQYSAKPRGGDVLIAISAIGLYVIKTKLISSNKKAYCHGASFIDHSQRHEIIKFILKSASYCPFIKEKT